MNNSRCSKDVANYFFIFRLKKPIYLTGKIKREAVESITSLIRLFLAFAVKLCFAHIPPATSSPLPSATNCGLGPKEQEAWQDLRCIGQPAGVLRGVGSFGRRGAAEQDLSLRWTKIWSRTLRWVIDRTTMHSGNIGFKNQHLGKMDFFGFKKITF